ncbi:MAG: dipeptidase [Acidobacteriota bacterium]
MKICVKKFLASLFLLFFIATFYLHGQYYPCLAKTKSAGLAEADAKNKNNSKNSTKNIADEELWKRSKKIHEDAIIIDTHTDTPLAMLSKGFDIGQRSDRGNFDLIRMKEGGLDAAFFAVFTANEDDDRQPSKKAFETIDEILHQVEKYPELACMAYSPEDIRSIHKAGKRAILIGMENGSPLEGSLRLLRDFYRIGVRYIGLTHWENNSLCDAATSEKPKWNGLSDFGRDVVREMNRIGMIIDVSHISEKAITDILEISRAPVIASHSSTRALCDIPRNLSDDAIKAIAKKGGVVQINFFSGFLDDAFNKKSKEVRETLKPEFDKLKEKYKDDQSGYWTEATALWAKHAPPSPGIETLIDHIEHVVKIAGVEHVGLGSDFDGAGSYPEGLNDVTGYPLITLHLLKRGYSEADVKKILGANFLRVFEEVVKEAKK